jgi:hypothetical protein
MGDTRLEPLVLSEPERRTLENWAMRRKTAQGLALRARIVLVPRGRVMRGLLRGLDLFAGRGVTCSILVMVYARLGLWPRGLTSSASPDPRETEARGIRHGRGAEASRPRGCAGPRDERGLAFLIRADRPYSQAV